MTSLNPNLRGQRISREELIAESQEVLLNAGVGNHSRAQFLVEVSQEVVGNDNPLFCQLQSKIHSHESESWIRAFTLVFQYLSEHDLQSTLSAVEVEFGQGELPVELTRRKGESSSVFQSIMRYAPPPRATTFKERVHTYIEEVEQHDMELQAEEDEELLQRRMNRRNVAQETTRASPKVAPVEDINRSRTQSQSRSSQQRNRQQKRVEASRPSPQITPKVSNQSHQIETPVERPKASASKSKSARRSVKKKRPTSRSSELSDDFVIEEVIPPRQG
ncbi:hypothetical protein TRFO_16628 [Tritrichomonas foetus]|uniref:LisH domain-containing protein n=1 Tax=Tritrichomonas foetus TaxID=1144522 RepID=A0A1J4KPR3_9EUKA|nr:hypothetical protein TRFO_16628 [Tritrichomonas foetus]|eukprot:OHT13297.1 hypothetical protein TRFO_16628 [Tritrichomonas foetus]